MSLLKLHVYFFKVAFFCCCYVLMHTDVNYIVVVVFIYETNECNVFPFLPLCKILFLYRFEYIFSCLVVV